MSQGSLPRSGPYTVVYTDVDASTAMNERLGDARARAVLRAHHALVRREAGRHGGVELQQLGDGFKLAFADPSQAVEFAVTLQAALQAEREVEPAALYSVRVGIHTGDAIQESGDLFGRTVIAAQRILSRARPGEILVSESTVAAGAAPAGSRYVDRGVFRLKGLEDGLRLHELVYQSAYFAEPGAVPRSVSAAGDAGAPLGRSPMVDRRRELALLDERLDEVEKGRGAVVLVSGEPGIGKTRLCTEFLEMIARRGVALGVGRAVEEGGVPFGPIVGWLRELLVGERRLPPRLARELRPLTQIASDLEPKLRARRAAGDERGSAEEQRARLLAGLAALFAEWTRSAPFVLLLDDVQWADSGTMQALRVIARGLTPHHGAGPSRLLVLLTCRSEVGENAELAALLRDLDHDRVLVRLPLPGLPDPDVRALLRSLLPAGASDSLAARLAERSHGNPYFAEELSRDLRERGELEQPGGAATASATGESIPLQLKALLEERLGRISDECLAALRLAALFGPRFRFQVLLAASGLGAEALIDALEQATSAHLLRGAGQGGAAEFEFLHPLVAEVLREGTSLPRRQRMHLRIADALETLEPAASAEIARHLLAAGEVAPDTRIARWCRVAGESAARLQLFDEAARMLDAALRAELRANGEGPAADEIRLLMFPAVGQLGDLARATELGERAIRALEALGKVAAADRARAVLGRLALQHTLAPEALRVLEPAVTRPGPIDAARGEVLAQYGVALDLTGRAREMRAITLRLRRVAQRIDSAELEESSAVLFRNWYANHTPSVGRALRATSDLLRRAEARRDHWDCALFAADLGLFQFISGHVRDALVTLERALSAAERMSALATIINVRAVRATCHCYRGDWDRVHEEWEHCAPLLGRVPGALRLGLLLWARSRTDGWLGRPGSPLPSAEALYAGIEQFKTDVLAGVGLLAAERGAPFAADVLGRADQRQQRSGTGVNWLTATQAIAEGWLAAGEPRRAAAWYASLSRYRGTLLIGSTDLILGRIAARQRRFANADRDLSRAVRLARREGLRPLLALARHEQAGVWRSRGRAADLPRISAAETEAETLEATLGMRYSAQRSD